MTDKQTGRAEVRSNTLQGQSVPNTFRSTVGPGTAGRQSLNASGGTIPRPRGLAWPEIPVRAIVIVIALVVFAALYLLSGTP